MSLFTKIKLSIVLSLIVANANLVLAQTKADIFDVKIPVTWLGMDYSQAMFIPSHPSEQNTLPEVNNNDILHDYIPAWNYLFMIQPGKFNIARAIHRPSIINAISVTEKVNNKITKNFIGTKQIDLKNLSEQQISDLVKNYDFQGKTGIGLLFFVDVMDRETDTESVWVTFVDMSLKTVLFTAYETGKTGGLGFRNNWAAANVNILLAINKDFDQWQKDVK